jgi:hypothetical protein
MLTVLALPEPGRLVPPKTPRELQPRGGMETNRMLIVSVELNDDQRFDWGLTDADSVVSITDLDGGRVHREISPPNPRVTMSSPSR